jgi:hypothetical protein
MRAFLLSLLLSTALTNADVVKLIQAGLSAETVEAKIAASATSFDTSTDALVALAKEGVPDRVIRKMVTTAPASVPAPSVLASPAPPRPKGAFTRRYDIAVHTDRNVRCEGAELRVDGKGIAATRCRKLDFNLAWSAVESVCYDYGFRGTVTLKTASAEHRISTVTPAEAKRIVEHIRTNAPAVAAAECGR